MVRNWVLAKFPTKHRSTCLVIGAWSLRHSIRCGDGQGPIGIDQNIVLNLRKWSALQLTGQPPAISEIFVQPGGRQRERVVVPYFRRRAKTLQRPPRTIRQWSIRARDSSANHGFPAIRHPERKIYSRERPYFIEVGDCGHLRVGSKVACEIRQLQQASPRQPSDRRRGVYCRYVASGLLTIAVTEAVR
jgi:hypothetical protein